MNRALFALLPDIDQDWRLQRAVVLLNVSCGMNQECEDPRERRQKKAGRQWGGKNYSAVGSISDRGVRVCVVRYATHSLVFLERLPR